MSDIVPSFNGTTALACANQLRRARGPPQSLAEVLTADTLALNDGNITVHMLPTLYPGCACRLSENGCIDPSGCQSDHSLFRIPMLNRWCDQTTCRVRGGGYLLLWSGWARPAAMKLLGRHPTLAQVANLVVHSHPRTLHTAWRYDFTRRRDETLNVDVIDISSNQYGGVRGKHYLKDGNPAIRFGQHSLYVERAGN